MHLALSIVNLSMQMLDNRICELLGGCLSAKISSNGLALGDGLQ